MVRCVRRPVRLEEPEQSVGNTGQHGPQRGVGVSGPAPPQGACENLVSARKLLASQQLRSDSTVQEGLKEKIRLKMMDE